MIYDIENTKGKQIMVYDAKGTPIGAAFKYNSETREVFMYLTGKNASNKPKLLMKSTKSRTKGSKSWAPMMIKIKIPGSYIVINGVKY